MSGPSEVIEEFHQYITPDSKTYDLVTNAQYGRWVINSIGWGTPPIDYITQQGPFQHGTNLRDMFLKPRVIQLLVEQGFCDRDGFWAGRADLLDFIRPNRQATATAVVTGKLRRLLSNGNIRDIDCLVQSGPTFSKQVGQWKEWGFRELLRFICFNPVIYDPTQNTQSNWDLPNGAINDTQNVTYGGTWEEYPTLILTGPINNPKITNVTTGEVIELTYNIPAAGPGNIVTITLTYGLKTVVDDADTNLIGTVTTSSNLATFHLAPDPEAALGVNAIKIEGTAGVLATTDFEVQWLSRYFGI